MSVFRSDSKQKQIELMLPNLSISTVLKMLKAGVRNLFGWSGHKHQTSLSSISFWILFIHCYAVSNQWWLSGFDAGCLHFFRSLQWFQPDPWIAARRIFLFFIKKMNYLALFLK